MAGITAATGNNNSGIAGGEAPLDNIDEFRENFDSMYLGAIPQLLHENGVFLAFLAIVTAIDALAGFFDPKLASGERFRAFVAAYYPTLLKNHADDLWRLRNLMVHSFNPGPFALTYHQSHLHLTLQHGSVVLNAEDSYSALVSASQAYFEALTSDNVLQKRFLLRLSEDDGGGIQSFTFQRRKLDGSAA